MSDTQGHLSAGCPSCGTRGGQARCLRGQKPGQSGTGSSQSCLHRGPKRSAGRSSGQPRSNRCGARTERPQLGGAGQRKAARSDEARPAHKPPPRPQTVLPPSYWSFPPREAWLKSTSREERSLIGGGGGGRPRPRGPTRGRARPAGTLCAGPRRARSALQPRVPELRALRPWHPARGASRLTEIPARPSHGECSPPRAGFARRWADPLRARGLRGFEAAGTGMCRTPAGGTMRAAPGTGPGLAGALEHRVL